MKHPSALWKCPNVLTLKGFFILSDAMGKLLVFQACQNEMFSSVSNECQPLWSWRHCKGLGVWRLWQMANLHPLCCRSSRWLPCHQLCSYPFSSYINSFVNGEFRQARGLPKGNSACILKASFAIPTAIALFLFICLMFKVAFCCSRLPWGSISTVYVAPWASSHICLMSERYH